ncbi:MAG: M20 family metallo-hydrolase [Calditrichia bacterium]|nr:M20 family metallo-hydrolase [Calditrichia bacterium]
MNAADFDNISSIIDKLEQEAIDVMSTLISINSIGPKNDGPGEQGKADYLIEYLNKSGIRNVKNYPAPDPTVENGERPNLVVKINGIDNSQTLWILSHIDVVPAGDLTKWDTDPFQAVVKDNKIYGRGSEDNLQGLVSSLMLVRAFSEADIQPPINIGLVLVSDEETGSDFGLTYLLNNHSEMFNKEDLIVIPDAGEPDSRMIEVAEKSILWLKFETFGKQVHASTPDRGINAYKAAIHLGYELKELYNIYNVTDPVFDPSISTFEPTKKEANVPNINTIPGEDVFYFDCRILPVYKIEDVMNSIQKIVDKIENEFSVKINIIPEQKEQAAPSTPVDAKIVKLLEAAIKNVYKVDAKAQGIGGGTVAAIFRRKGYNAAVWATLEDLAHQPNEYCKIENIINDAKVFAHCVINAKS